MKIAFTADLHQPITPLWQVEQLVKEISEFGPDILILGGDLGESVQDFEKCLRLFRKSFTCPLLVLPGNHDLWVRRFSDSKKLWFEELPNITKDLGCTWLEGTSYVQNGIGIAGTIGWYDYSAVDPGISHSELHFAQEKFNFNSDALLVDWEWSDPEFALRVSGPFLGQLNALDNNPAVHMIIAATHFPIFEEQIHRDTNQSGWAFSNAYAGNLTLGTQALKIKKLSNVLSGHTHIGKKGSITRNGLNPVIYQVLEADYQKPAMIGLAF